MKTLTEYILESLIFEKKSVADLAEEKATEIINIVTSKNNVYRNKFLASDDEREILKGISEEKGKQNEKDKFFYDNSNIFKFKLPLKIKRLRKKEKYDLFIIINFYSQDEINSKLNSCDFYEKNNKAWYYIVLNCIKSTKKIDNNENKKDTLDFENIKNEKNTLTHEISHFYDKLKELGGTKNDTYKDSTINKYNKFLYYISQTEQRAFYAGFKQKLNENKKYQYLLLELFNFYKGKDENKDKNLTVEEFIKQFCSESYDYRLENYFKDSDTEPEPDSEDNKANNQKNTEDKKQPTIEEMLPEIMCHNPLRFLEYKYKILDSFKSFLTFISKNPKTKQEDNERKEEILSFLKSYNDDKEIETKEQLENVYNGIVKFYNGTFSSYMNIIKNFIKKHM